MPSPKGLSPQYSLAGPRVMFPAALAATLLLSLLAPECSLQPADLAQRGGGQEVQGIEGANGFKSHEHFRTSTAAATGYDAYAAWDSTHLYFGYTGQDVGAPACDPATEETCPVYSQGEAPHKYLVYYFDADPQGENGTRAARGYGNQRWELPFRADYFVLIRTDYDSSQVAGFYEWNGTVWTDTGAHPLAVADNDGSKFLEFALDRKALGDPCFIRVASWFFDAKDDLSYAYWPHDAVEALPEDGAAPADPHRLEHAYGFVLTDGQTPNASGGQANKDRPFFAGYQCGAVNGDALGGEHPGRARPFHSIGLTTSNDFSGTEVFPTSTPAAATGYDAYATWDATNLYFGYTGSDVGPGDCPGSSGRTRRAPSTADSTDQPSGGLWERLTAFVRGHQASASDPAGAAPDSAAPAPDASSASRDTASAPRDASDAKASPRGSQAASGERAGAACPLYEAGQAPSKWIAYYLDTDPKDNQRGVDTVRHGGQRWRLPFRADYAVLIRTDGVTNDRGYTGVADLQAWEHGRWRSLGPEALEVFINATSGFMKFALRRDAIGAPDFVQAASWFFDTEQDTSYAFWPANALEPPPDRTARPADGTRVLHHAYGFVLTDGQTPNASGGQANLDRPFVSGLRPEPVNGDSVGGEHPGRARPFHSIGLTTSNDFSGTEVFPTSTPAAATGYDAYATWDATNLYFGYTGSDVGPGDCSDPSASTCAVYELGQSSDKWVVYYLDTDPYGEAGSVEAQPFGAQRWRLPFLADYAVLIRTDGETVEGHYTGVADLRRWDGAAWVSEGPHALEIFDNSTSGFLKVAVRREALGRPDFIRAAGWFFDTRRDTSYAFWPANAVGAAQGAASGPLELRHAYGFVLIDGQAPNTSKGQANLDRPFVAGLEARPVNGDAPEGTSHSTAHPYHTIGFTNANDFTNHETFRTSTAAATGYDAYATWDATNLYFGYTGSDVGPGDCSLPPDSTDFRSDGDADPASSDGTNPADTTDAPSAAVDCHRYETGQSPGKWVVYYLDTDPTGPHGTTRADPLGRQRWRLPFLADYAVLIRTDGETVEGHYTGVADLRRWDGAAWVSEGPHALEIFDNSTSGFLKFAVPRKALGNPAAVKTASWLVDREHGLSYAYWPYHAAEQRSEEGATSGAVTLTHYYGFVLEPAQLPSASNGMANLDREFFGRYDCALDDFGEGGADYGGRAVPYHALSIDGSNGFTEKELFATSTTADTGYDAYLTWDKRRLYLGYTGSDIGGGDCSDPSGTTCHPYETGQAPDKWIVYYLDVDPATGNGTTRAYSDALYPDSDTLGTRQTWRLPFRADYAVLVRTDGHSTPRGHTGVAELKKWNGRAWVSRGPCGLRVFDNSSSGFLEAAVNLSYIGNPFKIKVVSWIFSAETAYAYWPKEAAPDGPAHGRRLRSWWGFELREGVIPNASANQERDFPVGVADQITYNTYTLNGEKEEHEQLPAENLGRESRGSPPGPDNPELFLTWDADTLYLALNGGALAGGRSDLFVVFDTDPVWSDDPRRGPGQTHSPAESAAAVYPFAADVAYQFYAARHDTVEANGADRHVRNPAPGRKHTATAAGWRPAAMPAGVRIIRRQDGEPTEIAIPWADVGLRAAGDSSYFHILAYLLDAGNGFDAQWPPENPNGSAPAFTHFRSYSLREGVEPFSNASLSVREEGGVQLGGALYGNVYLVPGAQQTVTLGANTTVVNELYIGRKATLEVGTNQQNPSGYNLLRIGRRLTVQGTLDPAQGEVILFDPGIGYPEARQPGGGFGVAPGASQIRCNATMHTLTLYNETHLKPCRASDQQTRLAVTDTVRVGPGGSLHTNGHPLQRRAEQPPQEQARPPARQALVLGRCFWCR